MNLKKIILLLKEKLSLSELPVNKYRELDNFSI